MDRSCPGRASTDKEDAVIAENQQHDHPPESMQKIVSKVVDKMNLVVDEMMLDEMTEKRE